MKKFSVKVADKRFVVFAKDAIEATRMAHKAIGKAVRDDEHPKEFVNASKKIESLNDRARKYGCSFGWTVDRAGNGFKFRTWMSIAAVGDQPYDTIISRCNEIAKLAADIKRFEGSSENYWEKPKD